MGGRAAGSPEGLTVTGCAHPAKIGRPCHGGHYRSPVSSQLVASLASHYIGEIQLALRLE
jgi:hypothetical protein